MRNNLLVLVSSLLLACGSTAGEGTTPAAATPPASVAPPSATRPGPEPPPSTGEGYVALATSVGITSAGAFFGRLDAATSPDGCVGQSTLAPDTSSGSASAGTITIDAPGAPKAIELAYDGVMQDYASSYTGEDIPPGSTLHVHAAGSPQIPAFVADVTTLAPPELLSPADGSDLPSGDLAVAWTPTQERFRVQLDVGTTEILCTFDGASGKGVIPASVLGPAIATSDGSQPASLLALVSHATKQKAGGFDVAIQHLAVTSRDLKVAKK